MTLSVCLIVKDEEQVIERCLACVAAFADEIIVADSGSTDGTVDIARKFTQKVFSFKWQDDFAAARNFAIEKATGDFIMWIDADDIITEENCKKIANLLKGEPNFDMVFLPYAVAFDGDTPTFVYYRERIFRRSMNFRFKGSVHEAIEPAGRIIYSDAAVYHKKEKPPELLRNLRIYQKQIACGICLDEREKFYYGRELLFNKMYRESIAVLEDFINGNGWIENKIEACVNLYQAYMGVNDEERALSALLKSFIYAPPRSEACCILGEKFMRENDVNSAIYWYQLAITAKNDIKSGGFINLEYGGFIPYMQLCVLYDRLGDYARANACNEEAGKIKPHNQNYLSNKKYFSEIRGIQSQ